jgi:amino acid adenylation domain-containing protein
MITANLSTLVELLRWRAANEPNLRAFTFLIDGENDEAFLSYGGLDHRARLIAAAIQARTKPGDRVLLLYPQGLEYIAAFFGSLYAATIAVPAYPPRRRHPSTRLESIFKDCEASLVLTSKTIAQALQQSGLEQVPWLLTEELQSDDDWRQPKLTSDSLAFIQYTSGSTGAPKGVMLSHRNLLHNERMIQAAFQQTRESIVVGWLPIYHDMGLIGNVLQPLYVGCPCVLMSPVHFLQRPLRWLHAISGYRATTSGGPNFAYDLCVRKISDEQKADLDLSTWAVAFNGAEPIRANTLERFATHFESCGFRREAFRPCYGLAEATLMVTRSSSVNSQTLVSSGQTILDQKMVIVNPESLRECAPNETGEIWVSSGSVAQGYWKQPEETARVFQAHRADTGEGPFLRTEDLGFIADGQLFVTGRLKDLIIIRGRNHYPQDIELAVEESHPALRPGCGAAFSVEVEDEERLVIVQELERNRDAEANAAIAAIRFAVAQQYELQAYAVVLIAPGTLPKTTSGKVQRRQCRSMFLAERLNVRAAEVRSAPDEVWPGEDASLRSWLVSLVAGLAGIKSTKMDLNQPLTNYGLDSLTSMQLQNEIEMRTGRRISLIALFSGMSLTELADELSASPSEEQTAPLTGQTPKEYGLSYGQKALWFLQRLNPESTIYNIARAIEIFDELDVAALKRAFQSLLNHHPVLRTTFREVGDQVLQQVDADTEACFHYESAGPELEQRLAAEAERPFDFERGPFFRVFLYQRSLRDYVLLLVVHHIVVDLWSLALLFDELWEIYAAEVEGKPFAPARSPLAFSDYVFWQERLLLSPEGSGLKDYWAKQLAGEALTTKLTGDGQRSTQPGKRAACNFDLDSATAESLRRLAQNEGTTLYVVLLAALFNLLSRYTGQSDLVVGSIASGRTRAEFARTVGFFANPVVLRTQLESTQSFASFVRRLAHTVQEALDHQQYPFALLVEDLQPVRDTASSPLFQVLFNYQKFPKHEQQPLSSLFLGRSGRQIDLHGLTIQAIDLPVRQGPFALSLTMADDEAELMGAIEFQTDLFDAATVERFSEHFSTMLTGIAANPHSGVTELPLLTARETEQLQIWNATTQTHVAGQRLHDLFAAQVHRTPNASALIVGRETLSYAELNARANRLAHHLQSLDVGPEALVGVFLDRSADLIVTILAILKSGGAYLPLDLNYPSERLALMIDDSQLSMVVTRSEFLDRLPAEIKRVVCVDESRAVIDEQSADNPSSQTSESNIAYVIYTSGSTGRPHGIAIEHRSAVSLAYWAREVFAAGDLECVLASTSICFDLSVYEIFAPLSWGGSVVLVENAIHLIDLSPTVPVTLINSVPSAVEQILRFGTLPASVRTVNLAGEPLTRKLADKIYHSGRVAHVYNLYGPSEDTTYSTFALIDRDDDQAPAIGKPIHNSQAYILDAHLNPLPVGITGELYLGGEGLARGYLNLPELTASRFIPNSFPISTTGGTRLYKTGDLARFREDGNIEFLGRRDYQVKVRGYRIELGEVESELLVHPGVEEAVVLVRPDRSGEPCLVAYLVPNGVPQLETAAVRAQLQEKLPPYLIPSFFVILDALPRTPNGKLNRAALPAPATSIEPGSVQPRTEVEKTVASVWEAVLQRKQIGVEQNFFEIGGSSFKALEMLRRLEQTLHRRIPVSDLFKYPTISSLASFLANGDGASNSLRNIRHRAESQRLALERIQRAREIVS